MVIMPLDAIYLNKFIESKTFHLLIRTSSVSFSWFLSTPALSILTNNSHLSSSNINPCRYDPIKQLWTSLHHGSQDTSWWFQPCSQKGIISGVVEHPWHFYGRFKCRDSPSYLANLLTGSASSKWYTLAHPKNPIMCGSSLSFRTQQRHIRNAWMVRCCPCVLTWGIFFVRKKNTSSGNNIISGLIMM